MEKTIGDEFTIFAHCLKITQNVAFEFLNDLFNPKSLTCKNGSIPQLLEEGHQTWWESPGGSYDQFWGIIFFKIFSGKRRKNLNLGNYTFKSLGLKIKSYFFDPLIIFLIYEKKILASRLRDRISIFFILFSIELEFFVVTTGIKCINFVFLVNIKIRTFLLMIFSKNTFSPTIQWGNYGSNLFTRKNSWNWIGYESCIIVW